MMLKDVSLEIIQKCLNNCIHCSSNSSYTSRAVLEVSLIEKVIDDILDMGAVRLCLSGGEPFLHPNIVHIVQYAVGKGLKVDIYSSGIIGEPNKEHPISKEILRKCKISGLNRIIFNLQAGRPEIYDTIMQTKNNFDKVIESIKRTQECGMQTEIHFVPMKQNYKEIDCVVGLAKELGVCQVSFLKLVPHGRAKQFEEHILLNDEKLKQVQEKLLTIKSNGEKIRIGLPLSQPGNVNCCHAVKEKLYIKFDGSVFGCEAFKYIRFYDEAGEEIKPDNIKNKRVYDIYKTSEFLKMSKKLIHDYFGKSSGCENCPVQKYLKEENVDV